MKTTSACSIELRTFVKSTRMRNTTFVAQLMNIYEIFVNLFGNIEIVARKPLKWPGSEEEKHQYNYENKKPVKNWLIRWSKNTKQGLFVFKGSKIMDL